MAEKIKMRRQLASLLLPVLSMAQQQQKQALAFLSFFPAVQLVSLWGIINAGVFGVTFAMVFALYIINPCIPSWLLLAFGIDPTTPPDAAADAKATAQALVASVCTVTLAAAVTTARVPAARRRRIRRALAYVMLAAAVVIHYVYVSIVDLNHAECHVFITISCSVFVFFLAAGDLLCFLALLVGSDE
ncbi:unnamed protein product [Urochloa decumbens]|uniref:Uncharacterized protein n=1 Tax=Urochloa decumbens TaxID=240449 RepID=A0ABC8YXQ4_9POAL